ncbi:MAG: gamma-butyrobetaine hydroxylase-like domain-containing protein [Candidatus Acidiferrales bacterium]
MPIPLDVRKKPIDVKVHVSSGAGVDITWSDAHTSHYDFAYLREHCPCATCKEADEKKSSVAETISSSSPALPLFKPKVTARAAAAVGNYAIQIEFTDGHATGIYSFGHFREICPCESCACEFRGKKSA